MQDTFHNLSAITILVTVIGCSPATSPPATEMAGTGQSSGPRLEIHDGIVLGHFDSSGREHKLGNVSGEEVTLFNMYGGGQIALSELRAVVSGIASDILKDTKEERHALMDAIVARHLPGIWKVVGVKIDGRSEAVEGKDPTYLILRKDRTFRMVKKGRKPEGSWQLAAIDKLALNSTNDEPKTAKLQQPSPDMLELEMTDGGSVYAMEYTRTNLADEPKADDEE